MSLPSSESRKGEGGEFRVYAAVNVLGHVDGVRDPITRSPAARTGSGVDSCRVSFDARWWGTVSNGIPERARAREHTRDRVRL